MSETMETNVEKNEIMDMEKGGVFDIQSLKHASDEFFCSIVDDGKMDTKKRIYNALNNQDTTLSEHINEVLEITDVTAFPVSFVDENTGEVINAVKVVLIDKKGVSYGAVSTGIFNSLKRLFGIVGMPPWDGLKLKVKPVQTRNKTYTVNVLEIV